MFPLKLQRSRPRMTVLATLVTSLLAAPPAWPATFTWDGGGANNNWSTANNWTANLVPPAASDLVFSGSTRLAPANDFAAGFDVRSITFASGAGAFSIGGNAFDLTAGITNSSSNTQTFANAITLAASQTWATVNGPLQVAALNLGGYTLTLSAASGTGFGFAGVISGAGALVKQGAGGAILAAANTYTGSTTISGGQLSISASERIADSSAVIMSSGTTFALGGFNETVGSLSGAGTVSLGSGTLTAGGNDGSTTFSGVIGGSGTFAKTGIGMLTLSGVNTHTGAMTVSDGTLRLSTAGTVASSSSISVSAGATLQSLSDQTVRALSGAGNLAIISGVLAVGASGTSTTFGGDVSGTGGLTKVGSGILTLTGLVGHAGATRVDAGTLRLASGLTASSSVRVADIAALEVGYGDKDSSFSSPISGMGGLTKIGAGTLTLSGANTYAGTTIITAGTLTMGASNSLPSGSDIGIGSGGTLDIGAFNQSVGALSGSGHVTLGTAILTAGAGNASATFQGVMSGAGGFTKAGNGTLTLTGAHTYAGPTSINAGTLVLSSSGQLPSASSAITVAGAATLDLSSVAAQTVSSLAGAGNVNLGASTDLSVKNNQSTTFSGVISGGGRLIVQAGGGLLTLSGPNTYTGDTVVGIGAAGGTLKSGLTESIPDASTVVLNGGQLQISMTETIGALTSSNFGGEVWLPDGSNLRAGANNLTTSFSGRLTGGGAFTKVGDGTLYIAGSNATYTGTVNVARGALDLTTGVGSIANSSSARASGMGVLIAPSMDRLPHDLILDGGGTIRILSGVYQIPAGETLAGFGTLETRVRGQAGSAIQLNGYRLSLGDAESFEGFATDGLVNVGSGQTLTLNSRGFSTLGNLTTIAGGTLAAPNGIALGTGRAISGTGTVDARIAAQVGSTIEATGNLTLGSTSAYDGFVSQGVLQVNRHAVTLRDRDQAVLGALTSVGDSTSGGTLTAANGMLLPEGSTVAGYGTINGAFKNQGHVAGEGPAPTDALTFTGLVRGIGYFTGNVVLLGGYSPGNSPARTSFENVTYGPTGTVTVELGGLAAGSEHDVIDVTGTATLDGTLDVHLINGFHPQAGDRFTVLTWGTRVGQFASITGLNLGGGLLLSAQYGVHDLTLVTAPVPEPEGWAMLAAGLGLIGLVARRRCTRRESAEV